MLAAGAGSRFRGPVHKLLAPIEGRPLIWHSVSAAVEAAIGPVVVVTGAADLADALAGLSGVELAHNPHYAEGQASSLWAGLDVAARHGARAVVAAPGDQLGVPSDAWRAVAECTDSPVVIATFRGRRLPPARLDRSIWDEIPTDGDEGAKALFRGRPELVAELPCDGSPRDIDTVEEYQRWN